MYVHKKIIKKFLIVINRLYIYTQKTVTKNIFCSIQIKALKYELY